MPTYSIKNKNRKTWDGLFVVSMNSLTLISQEADMTNLYTDHSSQWSIPLHHTHTDPYPLLPFQHNRWKNVKRYGASLCLTLFAMLNVGYIDMVCITPPFRAWSRSTLVVGLVACTKNYLIHICIIHIIAYPYSLSLFGISLLWSTIHPLPIFDVFPSLLMFSSNQDKSFHG